MNRRGYTFDSRRLGRGFRTAFQGGNRSAPALDCARSEMEFLVTALTSERPPFANEDGSSGEFCCERLRQQSHLILLRKKLVKDGHVLGIQAQPLAGVAAEETDDLHSCASPLLQYGLKSFQIPRRELVKRPPLVFRRDHFVAVNEDLERARPLNRPQQQAAYFGASRFE